MLRSVGWLPPYRCPARRLLRSRHEGRGLITRSTVAPLPGPRPHRWPEVEFTKAALRVTRGENRSGRQRDEARDRPRKRGHLPRDGHHHLVAVLAARRQLSVATAQPHLGLPADGLDVRPQLLQAQRQVAADLGRIAIGPRPFHEGPAGMAGAGAGGAALPAPGPRRGLPARPPPR